ncbi:DoxX family membrane protein [candidate division KSB1 bacterium]|nr:DoxX family membrane protein [candidate division KSB1 bacterium]
MSFLIFLQNNDFPFPTISAMTSVYVQFFGAILILIGYRIRFASFLLLINFLVAVVFVHI